MPCGGRLPVRLHFLCSFGISEFILSHFEDRVPLKPVLGGVASVTHFITGYNFVSLMYYLLQKDVTVQNILVQNLKCIDKAENTV